MLEQVKASAGSGKTFELTRRFLTLLLKSLDETPSNACGLGPAQGYAWPEIMAVTFTNKAAAEMKERVISALKSRALSLEAGPAKDWTPEKANARLEKILCRFDQLNIRTIDSLLHLLMRVFALEIGPAPDFEAVFQMEEVFEPLYDRALAKAEEASGLNRALFADALEHLLLIENAPGFMLTGKFKDRLLKLLRFRVKNPQPTEHNPAKLQNEIGVLDQELKKTAQEVMACLGEQGLSAMQNFSKFIQKCLDATAQAVPQSAFAHKDSLADCLKKDSKGGVTPDMEKKYARFQKAFAAYASEGPLLMKARNLAGFVRISDTLYTGLWDYQRKHGLLLSDLWPGLAKALLQDGSGVPDAFCRMGTKLHYMLIDEFQDTGRDQWEALFPLCEECLSKGGGVFCVGDVKQAVYGWRGGDPGLFEEIPKREEFVRLAKPTRTALPYNWRSGENIVAFNNNFFARLELPEIAREVAQAMLGTAPDTALETFAKSIGRAFAGTRQKIPPQRQAPGGFVRLARIMGENKEDMFDKVRESLRDLFVNDLFPRRPYGDVAVLVRTNPEAAEVSQWLLSWNIPVVTENSLRLAEHPLVRQLLSFLSFLDYPLNDTAFWGLVGRGEIFSPLSGFSPEELNDWLAQREQGPLYQRFKEDFPHIWDRLLAPFHQKSGFMGPYDTAMEIIRAFNIFKRFPEDELFVRRFLEVVHLAEEKGHRSLSTFLEFWNESGTKEKVPLPERIEAVRVMTIHKAKGLEFPVVVVPFHHWRTDFSEELMEHEFRGMRILVPLAKGLGDVFYTRAGQILQEQLNLLYVAWTRPVSELYCLLTTTPHYDRYPMTKALDTLLAPYFKDPEKEDEVYEFGEKPELKAATAPRLPAEAAPGDIKPPSEVPPPGKILPPGEISPPMSWLPRLKIYRHFSKDVSREDILIRENAFDEKARGTLIHHALSKLKLTGEVQADCKRAAQSALCAYADILPREKNIQKEVARDITEALAWAASLPALAGLLKTGVAECPIMDTDGKEHRPDLVVMDKSETVVVEYKTGAPSAEHAPQVRRYLGLLNDMPGISKNLRGILVYLDGREIQEMIF